MRAFLRLIQASHQIRLHEHLALHSSQTDPILGCRPRRDNRTPNQSSRSSFELTLDVGVSSTSSNWCPRITASGSCAGLQDGQPTLAYRPTCVKRPGCQLGTRRTNSPWRSPLVQPEKRCPEASDAESPSADSAGIRPARCGTACLAGWPDRSRTCRLGMLAGRSAS